MRFESVKMKSKWLYLDDYSYELAAAMVWSKPNRYPWWPCYLMELSRKHIDYRKQISSGRRLVRFIGDDSPKWTSPKQRLPGPEIDAKLKVSSATARLVQ